MKALAVLLLLAATARAGVSLLISVPDQRLTVMKDGAAIAEYPVSTSRYGIGDQPGSFRTPSGSLIVADKLGAAAPIGAAFRGGMLTGQIIKPNTPGHDSIVTRILRLRGTCRDNMRAFARGIYIHGTAAEAKIGRPVSFGCIRMLSRDVMRVFDATPIGATVEIVTTPRDKNDRTHKAK